MVRRVSKIKEPEKKLHNCFKVHSEVEPQPAKNSLTNPNRMERRK